MVRSLISAAPELSRLVLEVPIELLRDFLMHPKFVVFLGDAISAGLADHDEETRRNGMASILKELKTDRRRLLEIEARRVNSMADETPEVMLRRLGETARFAAVDGLFAQRDPIARSLWAYTNAVPLFEAAERAMQVQASREYGTVYESWSVDASIPLAAGRVDHEALAVEIAARLHHEDGCKVEAIDLPADTGETRDVLVAVTFFGVSGVWKALMFQLDGWKFQGSRSSMRFLG